MNLLPQTPLLGGKYIIDSVIGHGNTSYVYKAYCPFLGQFVAIKEFYVEELCQRTATQTQIYLINENSRAPYTRLWAQFWDEVNKTAAIDHPNVITISETFCENNTAYFVMEYHDSGSLEKEVQENGPLKPERAKEVMLRLCDAMVRIHSLNILHLDLKPSNILLNSNEEIILIDFGISKAYDNRGNEIGQNQVGYSDGYSPPESYLAGSKFSEASDVYSLGAILYYLLTGRELPPAKMLIDSSLDLRNIPHWAQRIIQGSVRYTQNDRIQHVDYIQSLLSESEGTSISPWVWLSTSVAVICILVGLGFALTHLDDYEDNPPDPVDTVITSFSFNGISGADADDDPISGGQLIDVTSQSDRQRYDTAHPDIYLNKTSYSGHVGEIFELEVRNNRGADIQWTILDTSILILQSHSGNKASFRCNSTGTTRVSVGCGDIHMICDVSVTYSNTKNILTPRITPTPSGKESKRLL